MTEDIIAVIIGFAFGLLVMFYVGAATFRYLPSPLELFSSNVAEWWLVAVTFLLALFGLWQVMISRSTARRQLRAYVNVEPLGINPFSSGSGDLILGHVAFHNTGQVWAKNVYTSIDIKLDPNGHLSGEAVSTDEAKLEGKTIIGPRAKIPRGTRAIPIAKSGWLYVWGMVRYDDGFKKGRVTKFCHRYPCEKLTSHPEGGSMIDREHARYHEHGNEAD